jgi:phage tail sheath gpL-like
MAVGFQRIPPNLRVPLSYFELDPSQAATQQQQLQLALMLGSVRAGVGATVPTNTPFLVRSADEARGMFGAGTALARMAQSWFRNNGTVPLYALCAVNTTFTAAEGSVTITGPATSSGILWLYIGGILVRQTVAAGRTAAQIASDLVATIAATPEAGVTAVVDTLMPNIVDLTAVELGVLGNMDVTLNFRGALAGEMTPPGLTIVTANLEGGTGSPNLAQLLAFSGTGLYDFLISPYALAVDLDDIGEWLNDTSGRWAWTQMLYGHAFTARQGTVAQLSTFGNSRNDEHVTIVGYNGSPTPPYEWAAAFAGQAGGSLIVDPARPVQSLPLVGVLAPPDGFSILEQQILLFDGISTTYSTVSGGLVHISRAITTYQHNVWNAPDNSFLDVETMYTAAYFNRFMRDRINLKFPRHKLANDGTQFGAGQSIVTPAIIRAEMIAAYGQLEELGLMENAEAFRQHLVVERDALDPNRVNVLLPPDFVNQLRVVAGLVQFRLQFAMAG